MTCSGVDIESGYPIEITFDDVVLSVAENDTLARDIYVAPGFIDIQVNGFAGVDYNNPATPHDEIARSLRALFATGVTRFYPTVITGPPALLPALHPRPPRRYGRRARESRTRRRYTARQRRHRRLSRRGSAYLRR